ncbi:LOW QUALITY PROTEIN: solute carrier family 12 member 9-like [Macrobrachium nipponense]|uniref:LOW QUALITY PROTEIN: solute carrier family 12 member 9-like n=1 Tax=Macrobrachium nipponense TaxID=159736 RepID=UPI0030C8BCDA
MATSLQAEDFTVNSTNSEVNGIAKDTEVLVGVSKKEVRDPNTQVQKRASKFRERAPLLSQRRLFRSLSGREISNVNGSEENVSSNRTLGTFDGVFAPVSLSQFSALLFLRVGFIIGNIGLLYACCTLTLGYSILLVTILSICAISTNGAVEGGGAYFMISRTLGPEFGGAIGALFFFANVFSSGPLYFAAGCVEGILDSFGTEGGRDVRKLTVVIFATVLICTGSVIISFAIDKGQQVPIPFNNKIIYPGNSSLNESFIINGTYTGFSLTTLNDNLFPNFTYDYTTVDDADDLPQTVDFATLFAVLFSGVTGIMAGANMSGELKEPGKSIPRGTLLGSLFTFLVYLLLFLLTASTCSRFLLNNNYTFMMAINFLPQFVTIGIVTATMSASLSNIIGSSRILAALVKDNIYGRLTFYIGKISIGTNPVGAVLVSAVLVELVLLIGGLNEIAQFTSIFFLLSYLATNMACLGLEWASAPNFRPTFRYFTWWTAILGIIGNGAMMFVISAATAGICIIILLILIIILHLQSPSEQNQWGSISQALIFHQVRKYLLLLDSRKDHVKFWRPQMLLMVANPQSACPLIDFTNDLKKSGLYVLGHVKVGNYEENTRDFASEENPKWMALVDHLKVKAFVEITVGRSVREGLHHLARISGLGAMKPNTILFGFPDSTPSQNFFTRESSPFNITSYQATSPSSSSPALILSRPAHESISSEEFVSMVRDVLLLGKNICVCRHFHLMDKVTMLKKGKRKFFIDVWPTDFFNPDESNIFGTTSLVPMQLATILNMVSSWQKRTALRVFICVSSRDADPEAQKKQVKNMLLDLRINASIISVPWDRVAMHLSENNFETESTEDRMDFGLSHLSESYISGVNNMIMEQSVDTAVTFLSLPQPPEDRSQYPKYLKLMTDMTNNLRPTILVHGVSAVTTTNL